MPKCPRPRFPRRRFSFSEKVNRAAEDVLYRGADPLLTPLKSIAGADSGSTRFAVPHAKPPWFAHLAVGALAACFAAPLGVDVLVGSKSPEQMLAGRYDIARRRGDQRITATRFPRCHTSFTCNSLVFCCGCVAGTLVSCTLAAYAFRLRFPGRRALFALLVSRCSCLWQVTMIPRFVLLCSLGLYDSHWRWICPRFGDAFFIFLLGSFFSPCPRSWLRPRTAR